jgi:hypothetical protein
MRQAQATRRNASAVAGHIQWDNRFLGTEELLDELEAPDIYPTPCPTFQQSA